MTSLELRSPRSGIRRLAVASALGLALLAGATFRFVHLTDQLPVHDEWHALEVVAEQDASAIVRGFRFSDYSVPIALYLEALSRGPGITESSHLLPFAWIGLAACLVLPLLVRAELGWPSAIAFSGLLATSPLLVYYSRFARSYAFAAPAAFAAVVIFHRWWRQRGVCRGVAFAGITAGVAAMNLVFLPFCLSPFLFVLMRRPGREKLVRLVRLGGLTLIASSVLIAPTLWGGFERVSSKVGEGRFEPAVAWPSILAALGMAGGWVACVHLALGAAGLLSWPSERRGLLAQLLGASALQLVAIASVAPKGVQQAFVFTRYLLPVLFVVLLLVAHGGVRAALRLRTVLGRGVAGLVLVVAFVVAIRSGPLLQLLPGPQNFGSSILYYRFFYDDAWLADRFGDPPDFYRRVLASAPAGTLRVVEAPYTGRYSTPFARYQLFHRQPVGGGFLPAACRGSATPELPTGGAGGFRFATLFSLDDLERLRADDVRFVILHRRPRAETPWGDDREDSAEVDCARRSLEERLGDPTYEDRRIVVFAIGDRVEGLAEDRHPPARE